MNQRELDILRAMDARDQGMERSAEHANREESEWTGQALGFLTLYAGTIGRPFLIEEARAWAESRGLPLPPDARAWGSVVKRAQAKGRIEKAGSAAAASSNLSLKITWRKGPRFFVPLSEEERTAALEQTTVVSIQRDGLELKGPAIPEPLASLRVRDSNGEDVGRFDQVVKGFVVDRGVSLVEAAARALPNGLVAFFPDECGGGSAVEIEGKGQKESRA